MSGDGSAESEAALMETIKLADGGVILFFEGFLPPELADRYFVELRDSVPWEQKPGVFGRLQPRLTASYGDRRLATTSYKDGRKMS